jgi:phosphoribosylformylglycinamidine synthase
MRFGVVIFPGTWSDMDFHHVISQVLHQPVEYVWHRDTDVDRFDCLILPGGFSYGDYLRCGAIARFSKVMSAVAEFAAQGGLVLGICNGFQVLCEAGLLPGVLRPNHHGRFVCRDVDLRVERAGSPWLAGLQPGDLLRVPVKHHDGAWYAPPEEQERVEAAGQVALRYADNPNGALADVACVTNAAGNVCGLMPHPEHAVDAALGPLGGRPLLEGLLSLARARRRARLVSA